jgi:hypothetical protein
MSAELNIVKYKNELLFGIVNAKHVIEYKKPNAHEVRAIEEKIELYERLQEGLFPIIRLTSCDIYEHTDNFNDTSGTNQFFKNFSEIEDDEFKKIINGVETYFSQNTIRSSELDWLHIDVAIYAIHRHTKHSGNYAIIKKYEPLFYKVLIKNSDYLQLQAILVFGWKIFKWALWIGAIVLFFLADAAMFALLLIALKGLLFARAHFGAKKDIERLAEKLNLISKAYSNLSQINYNKSLLINDLLQCRNSNIDIPNFLFKVIENP